MADFYFVDRIGACHPNGEVHLPLSRFNFELPTENNLESLPEISATLSKHFDAGLSLHGQRYLLEHYHFGQATVAVSSMIELAAELMRRWQFSDRPSRMQAFFACESLEAAKQFRAQYCHPYSRIFSVTADEYFRADMELLNLGPTGASSLNLLQKYWQGDASKSPFWEILLRAPLRLGAQIDPTP